MKCEIRRCSNFCSVPINLILSSKKKKSPRIICAESCEVCGSNNGICLTIAVATSLQLNAIKAGLLNKLNLHLKTTYNKIQLTQIIFHKAQRANEM